MKIKYIGCFAVLAAALLFSACDNMITESEQFAETEELILTEAPEPQPYPVIIGSVTVEAQPLRVVSLSPAITEMLAEMGYNGRICAIGSYCDYPIGIEQLENVGSVTNPDIDKIISLGADTVITTAAIASKDIVRLENAGINPIVLSSPKSLAELEALYKTLAEALDGGINGSSYGEEAYGKITAAVEKAKAYSVGKFIYITTDMKLSATETYENDVLSLFGENAFTTEGYISPENADFSIQPETIFCSDEFTLEQLQAHAVYGALDAVKSGNVIFVENKLFERPSGRTAQLIGGICQALDSANNTTM